MIWEKLKADISLWSCWRQTWLNGDGFEHRLFFLFLYDLGPFSSYAHGPICPTWFTKYGTKEWCLFQIWELTVKQKKKCKADVSLQRCDMTYLCADFGCYRSTGESTPKTWLWMVGYSKCWQHRYSAVVGCKNKKAKELI